MVQNHNIFAKTEASPPKLSPCNEPPIRNDYPQNIPTNYDGSLELKLKRKDEGLNYDISVLSMDDDPYFMVREEATDLCFRAPGLEFATLCRNPSEKVTTVGRPLGDEPLGPWCFRDIIQYAPVPPPPSFCIQPIFNREHKVFQMQNMGDKIWVHRSKCVEVITVALIWTHQLWADRASAADN